MGAIIFLGFFGIRSRAAAKDRYTWSLGSQTQVDWIQVKGT